MPVQVAKTGSSLVQFFDLSLIINLPERKDRLRSADREFAKVGWRLGRGDVEVLPACRFDEPDGFTSPGVRGCFHSHLSCLKRAVHNGSRNVLIFEDDIALSSALPRLTASVIQQLAGRDWDIVYFGYGEDQPVPIASGDTELTELRIFTGDLLGAHFYGVNSTIFKDLIDHLELTAAGFDENNLVQMPLDGALNEFRRRNPESITLIAVPQLGWQRPSRSDLTPRRFDQTRALWPILAVVRKLKYLVMRSRR